MKIILLIHTWAQPFNPLFVRWGDWQCGQGRQHPSPHRRPLWAWTPHQHAHHQRSRLHKVRLFSPLYENVSLKQRWGVKFCLFLSRQGVHGMLPLHLAALNAHSDCCRKLLSSGSNTLVYPELLEYMFILLVAILKCMSGLCFPPTFTHIAFTFNQNQTSKSVLSTYVHNTCM